MRHAAAALALALLAAGCASGTVVASSSLADMDRVRSSPGAHEGQERAPQQYAHAEDERRLARQADAEGDGPAATLYAERAMAAYQRALVLARLARATDDLAAASAALQVADEQARQLAASRSDVEREADELDKKLRVARDALQPVPSGPADPAREAARLVAARALATQGRLLCGAARLLSPSLTGLADAEKAAADLDARLGLAGAEALRPAPIDAAARARAACLGLLTHARRDTGGAGGGDADSLLEELAASGSWEPSRDERGVVVTLRDVFKGTAIEAPARKKLEELGRVAAAHPSFAVQVVVHDATTPNAREALADAQRGDAASAALVAGGADRARVRPETPGAHAPIVDPESERHRARNARVEVVFIAPGN